MNEHHQSPNRTWIFDVDGVIFPHNGYLSLNDTEYEKPLPGVKEFFAQIDKDDFIIFLTSRSIKYKEITYRSLIKNGIRFNLVIFDIPTGERILFNDKKPDGTKTAYAVNLERNQGLKISKELFNRSL